MLNPRPIFGPSTIGKSLYDAAKKNDLGEVTHLLQIGKFNSLYTDKDGNNALQKIINGWGDDKLSVMLETVIDQVGNRFNKDGSQRASIIPCQFKS